MGLSTVRREGEGVGAVLSKDAAPNYEGCIRLGYLCLTEQYLYTFEGLRHGVGSFSVPGSYPAPGRYSPI